MNLMWMFGLILLAHQNDIPDNLWINKNGEPISAINRSDFFLPIPGLPIVDLEELDQYANQIDQQIKKEPVSAIIDNWGNIVPETPGVRLNHNSFREKFFTYMYNKGPKTMEVPSQTVYPRVDSELLAGIRTNVIGYYVTYFNSRNTERSHNIFLASEAINNYVVFPHETFSFNKVVGKRNKSKGYLPAPIIVKGELSEGIGGGICQVSSTLYNAVDRTGMKILERYSHSKRVPYVPPGRDATVSWYGPDFIFKNNYNQPILIRAKSVSGKMVVMIFSSDEINYKPRNIPSTNNKIPAEVPASF
jgi:vancomycin resistance protein YoaR